MASAAGEELDAVEPLRLRQPHFASKGVQVLYKPRHDFLQPWVRRAGKAGDDHLCDVALIQVADNFRL